MKTYTLLDTLTPNGFYLTQGYGVNPDTYIKFGLLWHEGVDFSHKNKTTNIYAIHQGVVLQDWDTPKGNYGEYLVIWDDEQNCASWYCHLTENYVSIGDRVQAGQLLGKMGSTGNSTGPHLHLNFVLTDETGARLYNNKQSNLGFLDPQHPLDPNPAKYPPGVDSYLVTWVKELPMSTVDEDIKTDAKNWQELRTQAKSWGVSIESVSDCEKLFRQRQEEKKQIEELGIKVKELDSSLREKEKEIIDLTHDATEWRNTQKAYEVENFTALDALIREIKIISQTGELPIDLEKHDKELREKWDKVHATELKLCSEERALLEKLVLKFRQMSILGFINYKLRTYLEKTDRSTNEEVTP